MKTALRAITILVLLVGVAVAGKPSAAKAKVALDAWTKALSASEKDHAPVAKLTSTPFRIVVDDNQEIACDTTVTDRGKLADALVCARKAATGGKFKPYTAKALKTLWGEMRGKKAEIEALAKTHVLFVHDESGEDVHEFAIVAVTADADGTVRVAAVFSSYLTT
jgi:hypothetical protein